MRYLLYLLQDKENCLQFSPDKNNPGNSWPAPDFTCLLLRGLRDYLNSSCGNVDILLAFQYVTSRKNAFAQKFLLSPETCFQGLPWLEDLGRYAEPLCSAAHGRPGTQFHSYCTQIYSPLLRCLLNLKSSGLPADLVFLLIWSSASFHSSLRSAKRVYTRVQLSGVSVLMHRSLSQTSSFFLVGPTVVIHRAQVTTLVMGLKREK